jgi:hypothetical protein
MASNLKLITLLAALAAVPVFAQEQRLEPARDIRFEFRDDAPVKLENFDSTESRVSSRGGAQVMDLHIVARLRNNSGDTIRGVTLLLLAQEATPGGRMSISAPCINVAPNEIFPIRIDGRLMRPLQAAAGPLVRVTVDGILFNNHVFYGPDRLNSHRQMLAWEMQAERDRTYFKQVLKTQGIAGLSQEMRASRERELQRPHLDVQLARGHASGAATIAAPDRSAKFAFLQIPESPIRPTEGFADIDGNEVRAPKIDIQNTSGKAVHYVEIAWLVKDIQGQEYMAGSVPASDSELYLPPGRDARLLQDSSLRFSRSGGKAVSIKSMTGFVSQVEFTDHSIWIPKRESLKSKDLLRVIPPSPEEQRLTDLFIRNGVDALVRELNKF